VITDALIEHKNDPHPLRHTRRQIPATQEGVQFTALGWSQMQDFHLRHKRKAKADCYRLLRDSSLVEVPVVRFYAQV
jgi:hypothetical protein